MMSRREEVAKLAGVSIEEVRPVTEEEVQTALADRVSSVVLDVATQQPAYYWRVKDRFFLDDPLFGEVVDFNDLRYNDTLGLFDARLGFE